MTHAELHNQWSNAVDHSKNMAAQFGVNSPEFKEANSKAGELSKILNELNKKVNTNETVYKNGKDNH